MHTPIDRGVPFTLTIRAVGYSDVAELQTGAITPNYQQTIQTSPAYQSTEGAYD